MFSDKAEESCAEDIFSMSDGFVSFTAKISSICRSQSQKFLEKIRF